MAISTQYGDNPNLFGDADYNEARRQGYSDPEILAWMNANFDKLNVNNRPGLGTLYDRVFTSAFNEANNTRPVAQLYQEQGINPQAIPLNITDQYDFKPRPVGNISYNRNARSWSVAKEATDYKADYRTDYAANRRTDYETNAKANYALPGFLPTNLRFDNPTTLKTDYKTDYPTDTRKKETYWTEECSGWWIFRTCKDVKKERWVDDTAQNNANRNLNQNNAALNASNAQANITNAQLNTANFEQNKRNADINNQIQTIREKFSTLNASNANTNTVNQNINQAN